MEGNRKNPGTTRGPRKVKEGQTETAAEDEDVEVEPVDETQQEEKTTTHTDPEVASALASLQRVQVATKRRASDVEELFVRRKTPFPR